MLICQVEIGSATIHGPCVYSINFLGIRDTDDMDSFEINPSVPFTPHNSIRDMEFMYPVRLDEIELEQKLTIIKAKESPDKSSCGTPQRLQQAANTLIDNLLEQAVSKVRRDDHTSSPA